jgi:membrane protein involved in colicin uptake
MIKSIPSSANLAASYVKTTANRLITNSKANTSKTTNATAKAKANANAKAAANATAKANANAKAKANATAKPQTEVEKYLSKSSSSSKPVVSVITASTPAASAYLSGTKSSSLQQNIQKITQNLQSAKLVLANMTKKGGATRRRRA